MEHYSAIKKGTYLSQYYEVDEPRAYYIEWSKSEREQQTYINTCKWNLERWYWWTYLQGSNRDTDIKNRLVDTVGKGEGGMNWENSMETDITACKIDSKWEFVVWHRELNPELYDNLEGKDGRWEGSSRGGGDVCIPQVWFMLIYAESNTIL